MRLFDHKTPEHHARLYCMSLGLSPDAPVKGHWRESSGPRQWITQPRWRWYVGVSEDALRRPITGA